MDQAYMTKVGEAFLNELTEIEKTAFVGTLAKGFGVLGRLGAKGAKKVSLKGLARGGRTAYRRGAANKGGMWGGIKGLAKSPAGAAAGAVGTLGLAGYGGVKALSSDRPRR
ncbi:MAG: hypothetical protein KAY24_20110 [Candidatus Eisenbacteria sp.]|nr:hypothetical protein [Candidatus Eisenbacteria bacterium]